MHKYIYKVFFFASRLCKCSNVKIRVAKRVKVVICISIDDMAMGEP